MKIRYSRLKVPAAFLLAAMMAVSSLPGALAAGKKAKADVYGLDEAFFCWVYATDTIPAGVEVCEANSSLFLHNSKSDVSEHLLDCTVTLVSGDEALKDAVVIRRLEKENRTEVAIDNSVIRQPGEAVFRFSLEGEKLKAEEERTLRVIPYEGNEPAAVQDGNHEYNLNKGDRISRNRILSDAFHVSYPDVAGRLRSEGAAGPFADLESKTEQSLKGILSFDRGFVSAKDSYGRFSLYEAAECGSYQMTAGFGFANVAYSVPVTLNVLSYRIKGPGIIRPGETAVYSVSDEAPDDGRSFAWRLEGEGAELDEASGTVTVTAGNEATALNLIAVPSSGEPAAIMKISVSDGILGDYKTSEYFGYGFGVRMITEEGFSYGRADRGFMSYRTDDETGNEFYESFYFHTLGDFKENRGDAAAFYDSIGTDDMEVSEEGDLEIEGHPARYTIFAGTSDEGQNYIIGRLSYARQDRLLQSILYSYSPAGSPDIPPAVTRSDMVILASTITYDESLLDMKQSDGIPWVSCKERTHTVTAGKKLNFTAAFDRPDIANNKKLNSVTWSVIDADTGEAPEGVKISSKGALSVERSVGRILNIKVIATADVFHNQGEYALTVMPIIRGVVLDPGEIFLYTGSDQEVTVKAALNPDTVPPESLTWIMKKEGIADMHVTESDTAVFKAVGNGQTQVIVRESGGKQATLNVKVVEPVTAVTLAPPRGKVSPGNIITVSVSLEPKKAGNKKLEWSLDVDETVATINSTGQMKISKNAERGTVITVTCKAVGAPEPVVTELQIPVE